MKKILSISILLFLFACEDDKDETPPTVNITNIQMGSELTGIIEVKVDANDNDAISLVEFFVNGELSGTSKISEAIYSFNWDTDAGDNGSYQIYAKATDESDNVASSNIITVNVLNRRTLTMKNTTLVPIFHWYPDEEAVGGYAYQMVQSGDTWKIEVPKNSTYRLIANTPGGFENTPDYDCGETIFWDSKIPVAEIDLGYELWVNNNYFLLYTKNNDIVPISYTTVNKDLTYEKSCYVNIPNSGQEYNLGFYRADTNSNIYWYLDNHPNYSYLYVNGDSKKINYQASNANYTDRNIYAKYDLQPASESNNGIAFKTYDNRYIGVLSNDIISSPQGGIGKIKD
jgi:hypothetical protein